MSDARDCRFNVADHGGSWSWDLIAANNITIATSARRFGRHDAVLADIDAVSDHLRSAGVRLLYDEPKTGTAGSRINFTHPKDSGGVLIELVQHAAE